MTATEALAHAHKLMDDWKDDFFRYLSSGGKTDFAYYRLLHNSKEFHINDEMTLIARVHTRVWLMDYRDCDKEEDLEDMFGISEIEDALQTIISTLEILQASEVQA